MTDKNIPNYNINFENVDHSPAIVEYVNEKLAKHRFESAGLQVKEINIKQDHYRGIDQYHITFLSKVHNKEIFIKENGDSIFSILDKIFDVLKNDLAKSKDSKNFQDLSAPTYES